LPKRFQRRRFLRNQPIRNKNCLLRPCLSSDRIKNSNHYRGLSIYASDQGSVYLAKRFQKRWFFRNRPIRNKNCLWRPCLLKDRDEMSNHYRGPSKAASCQGSVYLVKRFQRRRFFRNRLIRNKNCLWRPCLLMDPTKFRFIGQSALRGGILFRNWPIRNKNCL
jgi:hypothetical protein